MRRALIVVVLLLVITTALLPYCVKFRLSAYQDSRAAQPRAYLGYDLNEYPGDGALPGLRKTFAFSSYWLGPPPGEKQTTWTGKRALLKGQGFGFVVLYNGRDSRSLKDIADARQKGIGDAQTTWKSAEREGFPEGTIIFLDIEEGGRLPDTYHEYIRSWMEGLQREHYRGGVYCSAIPVKEGETASITTAQDIQAHAGADRIIFWVYNLACPPSPGCAFPSNAPSPPESGFPSASIWQYAQSPRRREFTTKCPNYAADGNCYAPGDTAHKWFLDANVASSADPSSSE